MFITEHFLIGLNQLGYKCYFLKCALRVGLMVIQRTKTAFIHNFTKEVLQSKTLHLFDMHIFLNKIKN